LNGWKVMTRPPPRSRICRCFSSLAPEPEFRPSASDERLKDIDPDSLTPREALDVLYALKALSQNSG
jgi:DNA mismatch repair protein MutS